MTRFSSQLLSVCLTVFALSGVMSAPAAAQNYIGLSGGLMDYTDSGADLDSQGFTVLAGGQIDPLLSVEFTYSALASVEANGKNYSASVMALSGLLRSPGQGFEPFLRLGLARGDATIDGTDRYSQEKDGIIFGLGADFAMNYSSTLRVEYAETDIDGAETTRMSIGSVYRF